MKVSAVAQTARFGLIVFSLLAVSAAAQEPLDGPPPLIRENAAVQVSEHTYVIPDEHVRFVPNVGIIVGTRATLVVDTGLGPRNGRTVLREADRLRGNGDLYLMSTHFHPEHAGGASAFPSNAKYLVSHAQQQDLEELAVDMGARFAGFTPLMGELLADVRFPPPDILFEREYRLDLGGVAVRLFSLGSTHTRGDTMVYVEGDGVLFAGDVVMNQAFLSFNQESSTRTWLSVLDEAESLSPRIIVPSHGDMGDLSLIDQQRRVLQSLQARVQELKARGESLETISEALVAEFASRYPDWRSPNRIGRAVEITYRERPDQP